MKRISFPELLGILKTQELENEENFFLELLRIVKIKNWRI